MAHGAGYEGYGTFLMTPCSSNGTNRQWLEMKVQAMNCKQVLWVSFGRDTDLLRMDGTWGKGDEHITGWKKSGE